MHKRTLKTIFAVAPSFSRELSRQSLDENLELIVGTKPYFIYKRLQRD